MKQIASSQSRNENSRNDSSPQSPQWKQVVKEKMTEKDKEMEDVNQESPHNF